MWPQVIVEMGLSAIPMATVSCPLLQDKPAVEQVAVRCMRAMCLSACSVASTGKNSRRLAQCAFVLGLQQMLLMYENSQPIRHVVCELQLTVWRCQQTTSATPVRYALCLWQMVKHVRGQVPVYAANAPVNR